MILKYPDEVKRAEVDFGDKLFDGDILATTPTITFPLGNYNVSISDSRLTDDHLGVEFKISNGTSGSNVQIKVLGRTIQGYTLVRINHIQIL